MAKKKIAMLTGGGDAPGLNAVIYTLVRACHSMFDCEMIGYKFGYRGMYLNDFVKLDNNTTSGILHRGGSILYNSNKDNLFNYSVVENGAEVRKDVSDVAYQNMLNEGVTHLVVLGGDGTLTSARDFARKGEKVAGGGIKVLGVPKTIDNDLPATESTFGFDTAVNIVTENLGRLHTTAESHHRVIVVEVMGRSAGWICLHAGIAGSADVIVIPEIPYTVDGIVKKIEARSAAGKPFSIVAVTEGAAGADGKPLVEKFVPGSPDGDRFGGVAKYIAGQIEERIKDKHEVRHCVLGHIQRGGDTSPADRILSARYGFKVAEMIRDGETGRMVCLKGGKMESISLEDVLGRGETGETAKGGAKTVDPNGELVKVARALGISFGDL
ncbi:MAG: ATP-dependent 6-phosphofructokinase [Defluviitaleaceae bacterium]|nr:ATP-dependent 6-phosphofructokinase [Defluviitaleaceae bacterium]